MASMNDELIANERIKISALIEASTALKHDVELLTALASVGSYLDRLLYSRVPSEIIREGSYLEHIVCERLRRM